MEKCQRPSDFSNKPAPIQSFMQPRYAASNLRPERQYALISRQVRRPDHRRAPPQQEGVPHDLRLLLDPVAFERPAGPEAVIVAAERMAVQQQVPLAARLGLPDMGQLMNEKPLAQRPLCGEIVAIGLAKWMKMQVTARRHRDLARLQRKELSPADRDLAEVDRTAEHAAGEVDLSLGQPALATDRAGERRLRQRSSPAARTSAGNVTLFPPTKVTVTSALLPAVTVSASFMAMT